MPAVACCLALAAAVAACLPPAGRLFRTTLAQPSGDYPLPVTLGDQTDLVVGIEPASAEPGIGLAPLVQVDPSSSEAFLVGWVGGMCDSDATLSFWRTESGYVLHLAVHGKFTFGCPAAGIFRGVRIATSEPIPPGLIAVSVGG